MKRHLRIILQRILRRINSLKDYYSSELSCWNLLQRGEQDVQSMWRWELPRQGSPGKAYTLTSKTSLKTFRCGSYYRCEGQNCGPYYRITERAECSRLTPPPPASVSAWAQYTCAQALQRRHSNYINTTTILINRHRTRLNHPRSDYPTIRLNNDIYLIKLLFTTRSENSG